MDKGPWTVGTDGDRIDSDDFTRDASLILYGDFAPEKPEAKIAYLQFIADELNSCPSLRTRLALAEKVVEAGRERMKKDGFCPLCCEGYSVTWDSCDHHESCALHAYDAGKVDPDRALDGVPFREKKYTIDYDKLKK